MRAGSPWRTCLGMKLKPMPVLCADAGPGFNRPVRYALLGLIGAFVVAGLFNVFGQKPETVTAAGPKADLELYAPTAVRGGLLYEARFTITAHDDLKHAALLLRPGWAESQSINTI